jgi:hypothetical protein
MKPELVHRRAAETAAVPGLWLTQVFPGWSVVAGAAHHRVER